VALTPRYLADKSALARFPVPAVAARLRPLLEDGDIATCSIIDLEVLYSARSAEDYAAVLVERQALPRVPLTQAVFDRAVEVQRSLAERGQHRLPIPDVVIAAAAESVALSVLHYDADFERIAAVTRQPHEWVVPRGSI
jgi:predicted nucleic acid-binding protein